VMEVLEAEPGSGTVCLLWDSSSWMITAELAVATRMSSSFNSGGKPDVGRI
jgi:hypothetical protein